MSCTDDLAIPLFQSSASAVQAATPYKNNIAVNEEKRQLPQPVPASSSPSAPSVNISTANPEGPLTSQYRPTLKTAAKAGTDSVLTPMTGYRPTLKPSPAKTSSHATPAPGSKTLTDPTSPSPTPHSPGRAKPDSILEILELRKKYTTQAEELKHHIQDVILPGLESAKEEAESLRRESQVSLHQVWGRGEEGVNLIHKIIKYVGANRNRNIKSCLVGSFIVLQARSLLASSNMEGLAKRSGFQQQPGKGSGAKPVGEAGRKLQHDNATLWQARIMSACHALDSDLAAAAVQLRRVRSDARRAAEGEAKLNGLTNPIGVVRPLGLRPLHGKGGQGASKGMEISDAPELSVQQLEVEADSSWAKAQHILRTINGNGSSSSGSHVLRTVLEARRRSDRLRNQIQRIRDRAATREPICAAIARQRAVAKEGLRRGQAVADMVHKAKVSGMLESTGPLKRGCS